MEVLLTAIILAAVVLFVLAPLWRGPSEQSSKEDDDSLRIAKLQAAKEDKLSEIREAEMDFRSRKLSETDYRAIDSQLRGEALALIMQLDELKGSKRR